jgi:uncharacterized glyoxalase superfamily protein PhnB
MPTDLLDIIPVVPYADIRAGHDFLVEVVGLTSAGLVEDGDGHVVHGEVRAGDRRIWLHAAAGGLTTPRLAGAATAGIVVHVADVDAHFARARAAGATIVREPTDEDYGQREYGLKDPEGHDWYIATSLAG